MLPMGSCKKPSHYHSNKVDLATGGFSDHLSQQLFPRSSYGTNRLTAIDHRFAEEMVKCTSDVLVSCFQRLPHQR